MPLRLEITEDGQPRGIVQFPSKGSFVFGRHESCEVVVKGSGVSRRHALLSVHGDEHAIQDLASKNGTYVNGKEAKAEILLQDGDTIRLGKSVLLRATRSDEPLKAAKVEAAGKLEVKRSRSQSATVSCEACDRAIQDLGPKTGVLRLDDGGVLCPECAKGLGKRELLAERFRLLAKIGEGGVATVLKALDEQTRRIVAVKKMKEQVSNLAVAYLEREVEILRSLDHPGIVRLYDAGETGGTRYLVMELVHGHDLESVIESKGRIAAADAAEVGFAVAGALALAHKRGVVHRDVKPSNVLIDRSGRVKIVDFGVARLGKESGSKKASERLTVRGSRRGTPAYMAPEQALDPANAGPKCDVYGVGATLYHALSGKPPYGKANPVAILDKLDKGEPPEDFEGSQSSANIGLTNVVRKAMEHDPAKRFADADALRDAFAALLAGPPRLADLLEK
ncbi:MAG TPA: FHA domain-containing serine/threonine-protein kinase [Planctomycetota bacterium]|nr:FHA domain-containing serine/threonine-protein kinase [Planctomycetota bacterium]